jgi:arginyl-tRNA synthetase
MEIETANLSRLIEPHAIIIVRLIAQFPDTIQNTMKTLEPTTILTFLFRLTHAVNSSYDVLQVCQTVSIGFHPDANCLTRFLEVRRSL